ncbi:MAG: ATP-binding protein [Candidatus Polarisedimenticolaceae bacterium]|nr:ATP-binding protein [Candidatus Polarisedimenticolaceae bacterium]
MKSKITIVVLAIIIVMTAAANWALEEIKNQFSSSLKNQLQTILFSTNEALKNWEGLNVEALKHYIHIIEIDRLILKFAQSKVIGQEALAQHPLQQHIRDTLTPAMREGNYQGFFIISQDHINLASTRNSNLGQKSFISERLLTRALNGETLFTLPIKSDVPLPDAKGLLQDGQPTMFILGPLRDHRQNAAIIAILAFRIAPAEAYAYIANLGRVVKGGETYLFDPQGKILNETPFIAELHQTGLLPKGVSSILNLEIRDPGGNLMEGYKSPLFRHQQSYTKMAQSALSGQSGFDTVGYNNYRGIPVVGAWQWNKKAGIGLVTEISVTEAYRAYYTIQKLVIGALIALALFAATMVFLFTKTREYELKKAQNLARLMKEEAGKANKTLQNELKLSELIASLLQATANNTSEKEVLGATLELIPSLGFFGAQNIGAAFLTNPDNHELTLVVEHNLPKQLLKSCAKAKFNASLCGKAAEAGEMLFTTSPDEHHDMQFDDMVSYGKYSVPFLIDDKVEGIIVICMEQGTEFHSDFAGFLYAVSDIISGAIKRIRAEKTTLKNEQFASLGAMVAGVAHEINSPVGTAVTNISELIEKTNNFQRKLKDAGISKSDLENFIQDSIDFSSMAQENLFRAAELVRSFKLVAVDQSNEELRSFNFLEHINATITTLYHEFKRTKITIQVDCPPELEITSLPGAFSQIITNLTHNSKIHGFDDGKNPGEIKIKVEKRAQQFTLNYTDNGKGMNKEQQTKVFDPFYTTRRSQGGSGLGMNIVHNLITQTLNGSIELDSAEGQGVKFRITIPLEPMEQAFGAYTTMPAKEEITP